MNFGFIIVAGLVLASDAQAQVMISSFDQWKTLSPEVKAGYSLGPVNGVLAGTMLPDKQDIALARGLTGCIQETRLTSGSIATAIDEYFAAHAGKNLFSPAYAFEKTILRGACLSHINLVRKKLGQPEWPKAED